MQDEYGGLEVLKVAEVPVPHPGPGEVLVKVRAASINEWDQGLMRGTPIVNRTSGLRRPQAPDPRVRHRRCGGGGGRLGHPVPPGGCGVR